MTFPLDRVIPHGPEDDLWLEMHYEAGQLNMLFIRTAFKEAGYGLGDIGEDDDLLDERYQTAYHDIVERLVSRHGGGAVDDWERFMLASVRKRVGPLPSGIPVPVVEPNWQELTGAYVTDPVEVARPKPERHPDGVMFWTAAEGWDYTDIASPPRYAHDGDAGLDLACVETVEVQPGQPVDIALGVSIQPPPGMWYLIHGRSGAINKGLHVFTGIIDFGYRGPLFARVAALEESVLVREGDRLVQAVLFPLVRADEVVYADQLADSARGDGGFGSTGR